MKDLMPMFAAGKGHLDIVKFLILEKHCNPTSRKIPIHVAAQYNHLEILKFFVADLKCSPNIPGKCGRTISIVLLERVIYTL